MVKISFYDPDEQKPAKRRDKSGFTMDWVSELGWKRDPFERDAPLADFEDERQEINLFFIKKRRFGTVVGGTGMGKSTLLRWLRDELGQYKELDVHLISADQTPTDESFRKALAEPFRGVFSRGKGIERDALADLLAKKARGRYVLLVDGGERLTEEHLATIATLLSLDSSILLSADRPIAGPAEDELALTIEKRDPEQYQKILSERIARAGGTGMRPFTKGVVETMAEDTDTTQEFLELARETAINIALKRVTLDEDVAPEDLAAAEEERVEKRKRGKGAAKAKSPETSESGAQKSEKKRKYDELIESLTEGM